MNARAAIGGPLFLAGTGLRAGGRAAVLTAVVIGVTAFLVGLAPLWFERTADDVLRERLTAATEAERGLEFELRERLEPGATDPLEAVAARGEALAEELPPSLAAAASGFDTVVDSDELLGVGAPRPILRMTLRMQDVAGDVRWVAGRAPGATTTTVELPDRLDREGRPSTAIVYEGAISSETAAATGLDVGDRVLAVPGTNTAGFVAVDVVGRFDVVDPAAGRWFSDPTLARTVDERISQEVTEYHAVVLVDPGVYPALHGGSGEPGALRLPFRYRWRFRLDPERLEADGSAALAAELARLRAAHPFGGGGEPALSTGLADLVERYRMDRAAAAAAVAVALVGPLVAMLGMLAVVAAANQRRRASAVATVRSRGGGTAQAGAGSTLEALAVALPAALVGGLLATIVVLGAPSTAAVLPALCIGLAAVTLAALAAASVARRPTAGQQDVPGGRPTTRRLVLDGLVVAIATGAAVSLQRGEQSLGGDLDAGLAAAVPALLALAGGIVALRLYPAAVRLIARAAAGRRDLVAVHALRGVERGAAGQQVPLLALVLAISTGTFAVLVVGSLGMAADRAAAARVGADFRVEQRVGVALPSTLDLAAVPGVTATAGGTRADGRLTGAGALSVPVTVLVLDVPAWLRVVDGLPLGEALPAELAATPALDAGTPESPVPVLVGDEAMARLGLAPGEVAQLAVGGTTIAVRPAGPADQVPGPVAADNLVIVDRAAIDVALPAVGRDPLVVYVRAPPASAAGLAAEVDRFAPSVLLASRDAILRDLQSAPLAGAVRAGFGAAIAIALLYAVAVVAFAARQTAVGRRRELAVLGSLGLPSRGLTALLAGEVVPLVVAALVAGMALGALIAALVVPDLGLGRLAGEEASTRLAGDPRLLAALVAAPIVGAAAAVLAGSLAVRRADLAAATRAVEP